MGTRYIEKVKDQIRSCLPNQFSRENIEEWYKIILVPIEKLMAAHAYDHSLTEAILSNLVEFCSVEGNFRHEANVLLSKITPEVCHVTYIPTNKKEKYMAQKGLDVKTVLRKFVNIYIGLKAEGRWGPAKSPSDKVSLMKRGAYLRTDQDFNLKMTKLIANL